MKNNEKTMKKQRKKNEKITTCGANAGDAPVSTNFFRYFIEKNVKRITRKKNVMVSNNHAFVLRTTSFLCIGTCVARQKENDVSRRRIRRWESNPESLSLTGALLHAARWPLRNDEFVTTTGNTVCRWFIIVVLSF